MTARTARMTAVSSHPDTRSERIQDKTMRARTASNTNAISPARKAATL